VTLKNEMIIILTLKKKHTCLEVSVTKQTVSCSQS